MNKRRSDIVSVLLLLAAVIILFYWYTRQNSMRMAEQNKNYAADSASLLATQVDEELNNALSRISTYAYFTGEGLTEPTVSAKMLQEMVKNSQFDSVLFTDLEGTDYAPDGRTSDVTERDFYINGIKGENGISVIFDSHFFDEIMVNFYAPVRYNGEIIGVLQIGRAHV